MAKRNGPSDGKRFQRHAPSKGNTKKPKPPLETDKPLAERRSHPSNGKALNRGAGETLWTQELQDRIVGLIRAGNYAEVAARACGIAKKTFYDWLQRGGRGEEPFTGLAHAVEDATAQAEARDVAQIGKASEQHWQAAAWRLERKNPKRWGRKDGLEITGNEEKPVAVTVIKWGKEEVEFS